MELINANYNCRNHFIAGLLPELYKPDNGSRSANATKKTKMSINMALNRSSSGTNVIDIGASKSKKALRNRRVREAKRRRRHQKRVHFPEQDDLIAIVIVVEDTQEMKDTRQMYWEFFAVNRQRFKHRVGRVADQLEKVLQPEHRQRIYNERFSESCIDELTQQMNRM